MFICLIFLQKEKFTLIENVFEYCNLIHFNNKVLLFSNQLKGVMFKLLKNDDILFILILFYFIIKD